MQPSFILCAAIMLAPLTVTAEEAVSTPASDNPALADTSVAAPPARPGWGMKHGGAARHQRHGMPRGKGKQGQGAKHGGQHQEFHRQVINRLDLMDARLTKIEAMLEKLLQR